MSAKDEGQLESMRGAVAPRPSGKGDRIMYFAMRTAVARLGGIAPTAEALGLNKNTVAAWIAPTQRSKPPQAQLEKIAELSGVALASLELYYKKLEVYRELESFRRRPK